MSLIDTIECPICGPVVAKRSFTAIDRLHGTDGEYTYAQCSACDLIFMATPISKEDILKFYPASYIAHTLIAIGNEPTNINIPKKELRKHNRLNPIRNLINLQQWLRGIKVKKFIYQGLNKSSKILDVGCGTGKFLYDFKEKMDVEAYGVEISSSAAQIGINSYGIEIFNGELADAPFKPKSFDLITAWWSIEHMPDPENVIVTMKSLLKDKGKMIIGIPNSKSFNAWFFKERWYHLDCPRHLNLWNRNTANRLFEKSGLKITSIVYDKTPWGLLGSLQYFFYQNNYSEKQRKKISGNKILYILTLPWTIMIGLLGLSDIMIIYCEKNK